MNDQAFPVAASPSPVQFPIEAIERMAGAFAKSGLFGVKTPEQALALMLVAQAEGQHPATIAQDYDIIQGRPARKTHSVLARFQQAGGTVEWHELTDRKADATFTHRAGGSCRITWTIEQAAKARLVEKDNWKHYPRAMLRARCIAEGVRTVFPGAIGGLVVAEEAQDLPPPEMKDVTPPKVEQPRAKESKPPVRDVEPEPTAPDAGGAQTPPAESGSEEVTPENALKPSQIKLIQAKLAHAALSKIDFKAKWGVPLVNDDGFPNFRAAQVNDILGWIAERG